MEFDLDLAKEQSEKNPVYYVQYAHARICSIFKKLNTPKLKPKINTKNLKLLNHPAELELIKQLIKFPEIIEDCAKDYQLQRIPQYALDLASAFHRFYKECKVLTEDKKTMEARLSLILATKITLKNVLDLMGISAPEKM
jgi:arginyl-tRNA synthetase